MELQQQSEQRQAALVVAAATATAASSSPDLHGGDPRQDHAVFAPNSSSSSNNNANSSSRPSSRIRPGLLSRAASDAEGRKQGPSAAPSTGSGFRDMRKGSANHSESDDLEGGSSSGISLTHSISSGTSLPKSPAPISPPTQSVERLSLSKSHPNSPLVATGPGQSSTISLPLPGGSMNMSAMASAVQAPSQSIPGLRSPFGEEEVELAVSPTISSPALSSGRLTSKSSIGSGMGSASVSRQASRSQPGRIISAGSSLRSVHDEEGDWPVSVAAQQAWAQASGRTFSPIPGHGSGDVSEGGSSLGRAKSVSSVSSVTSTSSLEAMPFRQAPLGNVRAGYGGHPAPLSSRPLGFQPSDAPRALGEDPAQSHSDPVDGPATAPAIGASLAAQQQAAYNHFAGASEMVSPAVEASGPILAPPSSAILPGQQALEPVTTSALVVAGHPSTRQRLLPRDTQDDWMYRNAPGLAGGSLGRASGGRPGNALRTKLARTSEKLGGKPLAIGPFQADSSLIPAVGAGVQESGILTSSVTNAPLLVPKIPLVDPKDMLLQTASAGPQGIMPIGEGGPGLVTTATTALRPLLVNTASADNVMSVREATRRVSNAAELEGEGGLLSNKDAANFEIDQLLKTPTHLVQQFNIPTIPAPSGTDAAEPVGQPRSVKDLQPLLIRRVTPAEQVKLDAQAGIATLPDTPETSVNDMDSKQLGMTRTPEAAVALPISAAGLTPVRVAESVGPSSIGTTIAEMRPFSFEDAASTTSTAATTADAHTLAQHSPVSQHRNSGSIGTAKRPLFFRAATVESVQTLQSGASSNGSSGWNEGSTVVMGSVPSPSVSVGSNPLGTSPVAMVRDGSAMSNSPQQRLLGPTSSEITPPFAPVRIMRAGSSSTVASAALMRPTSYASGISLASSDSTQRFTAEPSTSPVSARTAHSGSVAGRPSASSPQRSARGPQDFDFGEVLGEGSYSTVIQAWDLLSNRKSARGSKSTERGTPPPAQRSSAAQAIAGASRGVDRSTIRQGKKVYAIKVLDKVHILKQKKQKYVGVEKEALSRLIKLPGVVTLYWTFQDRDSLYFVLELAVNGELLSFIKKLGSLDETCARYYGAQLLDTIDGIHKAGILHRDIKPENILLDSKMRIRVTDFGSAKILAKGADGTPKIEEEQRASSFVGTAEYVSPELLTDKAVTISSDWWAFGCVLYQMLAGRPPFKGVNEYQTFQKILKRDFSFPEGFPSSAKDLIDKLLALDPSQRLGAKPGDVEEMKKSEFFKKEDFTKIWEKDAPELKVGLYARPAGPEPTFDFSEDEALSSDFAAASVASPGAGSMNSHADDADASDVSDSESRPTSPAAAQPALAKLRPLPHKASEQSIRSSASSAAGAEDARNANRLLRRMSQGMRGKVGNWSALLLPSEAMLLSAPIIQKKVGTGQMFNKKRQLVLTNFPRLLCVKESPAALKVKSEVILRAPAAISSPLGEAPKPQESSASAAAQGSDAQLAHETNQQTVTSVEVKSQKVFAVHTPSRTFIYEDPSGDNAHWVRSIKGVMEQSRVQAVV